MQGGRKLAKHSKDLHWQDRKRIQWKKPDLSINKLLTQRDTVFEELLALHQYIRSKEIAELSKDEKAILNALEKIRQELIEYLSMWHFQIAELISGAIESPSSLNFANTRPNRLDEKTLNIIYLSTSKCLEIDESFASLNLKNLSATLLDLSDHLAKRITAEDELIDLYAEATAAKKVNPKKQTSVATQRLKPAPG